MGNLNSRPIRDLQSAVGAETMNHNPSVFGAAVNSASLSLIAAYGSDDEDDELPGGVGVQTKRELRTDDDKVQDREHFQSLHRGDPNKRKRLKTGQCAAPSSAVAPLPNPLRSSLPSEPEWTDDPAKHGGRTRSFPHVRNNWATYAFAAPDEGVAAQISSLQSELCKALSLEPVETPHLSLTRVVTVRHHWIHPFVAGIRESVKAAGSPFCVDLSGFEVFVNDEGTRTRPWPSSTCRRSTARRGTMSASDGAWETKG